MCMFYVMYLLFPFTIGHLRYHAESHVYRIAILPIKIHFENKDRVL